MGGGRGLGGGGGGGGGTGLQYTYPGASPGCVYWVTYGTPRIQSWVCIPGDIWNSND